MLPANFRARNLSPEVILHTLNIVFSEIGTGLNFHKEQFVYP